VGGNRNTTAAIGKNAEIDTEIGTIGNSGA
jgi:hypothetical protein